MMGRNIEFERRNAGEIDQDDGIGGDEGKKDYGEGAAASSMGRDANYEERTQVEVENTKGITLLWFLKRLAKIKKMNTTYDASQSAYDIDINEFKLLLPISDCTDDAIMACELDTEYQRTIKVDSQRTRVSEMKGLHLLSLKKNQRVFNIEEANLRTEKALTYFQIHRKTSYIQGPNEIFGPFMWLAHKDKIFDDAGNQASRLE